MGAQTPSWHLLRWFENMAWRPSRMEETLVSLLLLIFVLAFFAFGALLIFKVPSVTPFLSWMGPGIFIIIIIAFLIKFGPGILQAAFSPGSISLELGKTDYMPGDEIKGTALLRLNKPVEARAFAINFYGLYRQSKNAPAICEATKGLSGKRLYSNGERFDFAIKIPEEAEKYALSKNEGDDGLIPGFGFSTTWWMEGQLDISNGPDILGKTRVWVRKKGKGQ